MRMASRCSRDFGKFTRRLGLCFKIVCVQLQVALTLRPFRNLSIVVVLNKDIIFPLGMLMTEPAERVSARLYRWFLLREWHAGSSATFHFRSRRVWTVVS